MILELPTSTDSARYEFSIELDSVEFRLSFEWSERASHWIMSIADANGVPLVSGRRVVVGIPLLNRYPDPRLPAGMLCAIDTSGLDIEPGFADLGDRVKLLYYEIADVPLELLQDVG